MKKLGIDTIYNTLHSYEIALSAIAQNMKNKGNVEGERIYTEKVNTVRECIIMLRNKE